MSKEVAVFVASTVRNNFSLADLRLSNNRLSSGIITIAKSLRMNSSLKILDIRNNLVTEEAADAISSVILTNDKLERLYLGDNDLQTGAYKILEVFQGAEMLKS